MVPIMKCANERIPNDYFPTFITEMVSVFCFEYSLHVIDQDKIPRISHNKFAEFLTLELITIKNFFFPNDLKVKLNDEINNRMKIIQDIILYYMSDTQTLVDIFKKIDTSHSKGKFLSKVLARIIASRNTDSIAIKFCKEHKSQLT